MWKISQSFSAEVQPGVINLQVAVETSHNRALAFLPLLLLIANQGSTNKGQAVFPGLEYPENEPTSSEADLIGPQSRRQVPANHKITFPLMAIQKDGRYVGLAWQHSPRLSPLIDSPDRLLGTGGHVMGVLFPGSDGFNRHEGDLMPTDTESEYYNYIDFPELASFGDYGIARGLGVQDIRLFPVKFDVNTNTIKMYSKIVFQIDYAGVQFTGRKTEDELVKLSVINYDAAQYWVKDQKRLSKIDNSVLANGQWVKFEAQAEGIYKIDRAKLESFGSSVSSIDPRTIKIYNNGGKVLSEKVTTPRPTDLVENAIMVVGENDGTFDQNDYILFYGRGSHFRDIDSTGKTIKRFNHPFSDKNYFFITAGGENGKRVQSKSSLNTTEDYVQTSTIAFVDYEVDKINLAKSGRQFFGDDFSQSVPTRTYMNKLDYGISAFPINYKLRFVNASQGSFSLTIMENSVNIFSGTLTGYGNSSDSIEHRRGAGF